MLEFPKEIAQSVILIVNELLSCTQKSYSAIPCPILKNKQITKNYQASEESI